MSKGKHIWIGANFIGCSAKVKLLYSSSYENEGIFQEPFLCVCQVQQKFGREVDVTERVFVMDTQVAMTPDIKALKQSLHQHRTHILRV